MKEVMKINISNVNIYTAMSSFLCIMCVACVCAVCVYVMCKNMYVYFCLLFRTNY